MEDTDTQNVNNVEENKVNTVNDANAPSNAADSQNAQATNQSAAAKPKKKNKGLIVGSIVVVIIIIAVVAAYLLTSSSASTVKSGDLVEVYFKGSFTNGTVFQEGNFNFTAGSNQVISGFSNAVIGMKLHQIKNITLTPQEAYGEVNQSEIVSVPLTDFANQSIKNGTVVTSSTGLSGTVIAVNATDATVNFNPPLAGDTLNFEIEVLKISK